MICSCLLNGMVECVERDLFETMGIEYVTIYP